MTLRTALVVSGDTAAAQRSLAELDQSIDRVEKSTGEAGQEFVKASVGLERLRVAKEQAARAGVTLSAEQQRLAIHGRDLGIQQTNTAQQLQRVTQSAGAQRAGMQQLSYQIGDVATMFAMGARPMQIFASQSGQVIQAIQLMSGSSKGFIGLLGGPWGIAITSAITVLGSLGMAYLSAADDADQAASRLDEALAKFRQGLVQTSSLSQAMTEATRERVGLMAELGRLQEQEQALARSSAGAGQSGAALSGMTGRLTGVRARISEIERDIGSIDSRMESAIGEAAIQNRMAREAAAREEASRSARGGTAGAVRATRPSTGRTAAAQQSETERYIASLSREVAAIGLSEQALRQLDVQRALAAASTQAERDAINNLSAAREQALALEDRRRQVRELTQQGEGTAGEIASLEREAQVLGLVGRERERRLAQLEREAELGPLRAQLASAEAAGHDDVADALRRQIELLQQKYGLQGQLADAAAAIDAEREAAEEVAAAYEHLDRMAVGALSDIALHGQSATDVVKRLALSLADAALEAALLGTGPLAGILGGGGQDAGGQGGIGSLITSVTAAFGGGRASGGPVSPGKFYAVNERSTAPGLFIPLGPGRIEAATNDNASRGGGGGAPPGIMFDMRGAVVTEDLLRQAEQMANSQISAALQSYDSALGGRIEEYQARSG